MPADDRTAFKVVLALKPADEGRWAEQPRNATAPLRIGGVKPETAIGGATPASKRKTPADEQHSAADRGSAAEDAGRRGNCKANQPTNDNDRAARRRHGKSAATASVSKVAATVVDGGVEKLRLF